LLIRGLLVGFLLVPLAKPASPLRQQGSIPGLKVVVVEGDDAINNIATGRGKDPLVRLEGEDGKPVAGATVTFLLPTTGAGATFSDGQSIVVIQTDQNGQAVGRGLRPNGVAGPFEIRVTVSHQGQTTTITFRQVNVKPPEPVAAKKKGGSGKLIAIVAVVAGGAAGAALGLGGGGAKSPAPTPSPSPQPTPGAVLTTGPSAFGPP